MAISQNSISQFATRWCGECQKEPWVEETYSYSAPNETLCVVENSNHPEYKHPYSKIVAAYVVFVLQAEKIFD